MVLGISAGFLRILTMVVLHCGENLFWVIFAKIHQLGEEFEVFSWKVRSLGFVRFGYSEHCVYTGAMLSFI